MISFNQFVKCMRKEMGKKFQGRLAIKLEKVEKNNGVVITSLSGKREDNKEWLSVGLDSYYAAYKEGMDLEQLEADMIVDKRAFNRNLGLYLERRGFEKKLTLHMPRHCYTTYMKLLGADLENVEFSLGHTVDGVRGEYLADLTPDYVKLLLPKIAEMAEQVRKEEEAV